MLLNQLYPPEMLKRIIKPFDQWHPFPKAAERTGEASEHPAGCDASAHPAGCEACEHPAGCWDIFSETFRNAHIQRAERLAREPWPRLPADIYLQFARNGNRSNYEGPYFQRREILAQMVIAECMRGQGQFLDSIMNAVWSICEESSWCLPAHINMQKAGSGLPETSEPIVDLFAAETSTLLAWTNYLLGAELGKVSAQIPERIEREIQTRILAPAFTRGDFWWMGFTGGGLNNWNPWINSNWIASILLVEKDPQRRAEMLAKSLRSLDVFISHYPEDGGCDEGPSYWTRAGASLFDCLELLHSASGGQIDIYDQPLIRNMGKFIYRAYIDGEYFVNFADAPARLRPEASLVYRYGKAIQDAPMMAFGAWLAHREDLFNKGFSRPDDVASSLGRVLFTLFNLKALAEVKPAAPMVRDVWLDKIQVAVARDRDGSRRGLYLATKGGHNQESHNHNDVGHFIVYGDGRPLIIDAGVETYTRKTFSPQRYEIWTMQSAYHSLPTIDGVMQSPGAQFRASQVTYEASDTSVKFSLDIAGAYPPEAKLKCWLRSLTLQRGEYIQLKDQYELSAPVKTLSLSLVTPCRVQLNTLGEIRLDEAVMVRGRKSGIGKIAYDPAVFNVAVEDIQVTDAQLLSTWGSRLARILLTVIQPALQGDWTLKITIAKDA